MISQDEFNKIESSYGCGYYHVCWERACPCAITTQNRGLSKEIYEGFVEENRKLTEEMDKDEYDYCGKYDY
ncbi:hypothetical protein SAMN04487895_101499 [Paenibacillus sophorae]|uniref:DUF3939 domain-containing protein n=1 Tax=Paenibacillus sophorae TaxID=1333845 RepID=A0A1H8GGB3_9BACL|nr:hypothetical protein [Paenibacillus sophorae]QWU14210.1 DUF3939 domain-containing protein [Paenibacillus sophorae]SEN42839.1 hypothetical protein SAMN04487895_101499 [Paenibacillus sophorae]